MNGHCGAHRTRKDITHPVIAAVSNVAVRRANVSIVRDGGPGQAGVKGRRVAAVLREESTLENALRTTGGGVVKSVFGREVRVRVQKPVVTTVLADEPRARAHVVFVPGRGRPARIRVAIVRVFLTI